MPRPRPTARPSRRNRLRPTLERMEGRALMAHAGALDTSFGGGLGYTAGTITSGSIGGSTPLPNQTSVALESDGSILIAIPDGTPGAQSFAVEHLTTAGTLDTAFGTSGKAEVPLPIEFTADGGPVSLLVDSAGNIIVVGTVTSGSGSTATSETLVTRFAPGGTLDAAFGTDGVVTLDQAATGVSGLSFTAAAVQANDYIDLLGVGNVLQLTPTGAIDTTYGTNGLASLGFTANETGFGLAIQPNGQVVVAADLPGGSTGPVATPALIRLNVDGTVDSTLSQAGITASGITIPNVDGLIAEPDGQLLVLGNAVSSGGGTYTPTLALIKTDGSLATSVTPLPKGTTTADVTGFALEPDGDVVLTGELGPGLGFGVLQLTTQLTPDITFGQGGFANVPIPAATGALASYQPQAIAASLTNQVIVVGANPYYNPSGNVAPPTNYVVARLGAVPTAATPGDYNGDGLSDPAIYLTGPGEFAIQDSTGRTSGEIVQFGSPGAGNSIPAPGDYYGTGADDLAVYLPASGQFAVQDPTGLSPGKLVQLGPVGQGHSIPAPGDYYGTGRTDFAVYITATGTFAVQDPTGQTAGEEVQLGSPGIGNSIPVPGDYYGTGQTDFAVYLPATGSFAILDPTGHTPGMTIQFGAPGLGQSIPMPGDYDGSGKTELAVYIPVLGEFFYRPADGGPDVMIKVGSTGPGATLPMQGNYTTPGVTDLGLYLTGPGQFAYNTPTGPGAIEQFGATGAGNTVPVTPVVLSPFPGTVGGSGAASAPGEPDVLDFVPDLASKKPKA